MTEPEVSVIVPVLDEVEHVEGLAGALLGQTLRPDEVVFADGGSSDGTREVLERLAAQHDRIRVVPGPGGIAENRNAAIEAARGSIIACVDAGCLPDPDWLERITGPLREAEAPWVSGVALPADIRGEATVAGLVFLPSPDEIDAAHHVPPGASQAFRKTAWARVGGFPEDASAAEDTVFGLRMISVGYRPVFRPDAVVRWSAPKGIVGVAAKAFRWGRADGRAATADRAYWRLLLVYWVPVIVGVAAAVAGVGWVSVIAGVVPLGAATYRVRRRIKHLDRLRWRVALPVAYALKTQVQSLGWLTTHATPRVVGRFVLRRLGNISVWARRAVRPFIPDRIVSRLRSDSVASARDWPAVDVVLDESGAAGRWLSATPSTYRIRIVSEQTAPEENPGVVIVARTPLGPEDTRLLMRPLSDPDIEVSVIGETEPPPVRRRSVAEPEVAVLAVALRSGPPSLPDTTDPAIAYHLARQAGLRIALTPLPMAHGAPGRSDRVGDPGSVVILAAVPMHDVGGGSRGSQMAQEFLRRGYHVVYAHMFESAESVDLGLRYVHPNLETVPARGPDSPLDRLLHNLFSRLETGTRLAIAEIPHSEYLPAVRTLREHDYRIVYDLVDDWSDPALGGWGFTPQAEFDMAIAADHLMASAESLAEGLRTRTRREVTVVPNAVNTRLFGPAEHDRPADMPSGDGPVFEYHGSLYGDWFDWDALGGVAQAYPQARVIVIGDEPQHHPIMPDNVWFLGLKPQHELVAYLAHSEVGLLPFVVTDTTHGVSPLKVYECLAMGLPVAAPALRSLVGLEGVFTGDDLAGAVAEALSGDRPDPDQARADHGWPRRVESILDVAGLRACDLDTPVEITVRHIPRYTDSQRRLY